MAARNVGAVLRALLLAALILPVMAGAQDRQSRRRWVPEFDASAAGVVAALVAGGGILLARRKRR